MYRLIHNNDDNKLSEAEIKSLWLQNKSRCGYCIGIATSEWEIICDCFLYQKWNEETLRIASFGKKEC